MPLWALCLRPLVVMRVSRTDSQIYDQVPNLCPVAEPADAPDTSINVFGNIRIISELENAALPNHPGRDL